MIINLRASQAGPDESSLHPIGYRRFNAEDAISESLARTIVVGVFLALSIDWEPVLSRWIP